MSDKPNILIKSKSGGFKTVNVSSDDKKSVVDEVVASAPREEEKVDVVVAKQENNEPQQVTKVRQELTEEIGEVSENTPKKEEKKEKLVVEKEKKQNTVPKFYFDVEDEEEVAKFKDEKNTNFRQSKHEVLEERADSFIKSSGLSLEADVRQKMVKSAISFLSGIRSKIDFKQVLTKDIDKGGLGLSEEHADSILKKLVEEKKSLDNMTMADFEKMGKKKEVDLNKVFPKEEEVVQKKEMSPLPKAVIHNRPVKKVAMVSDGVAVVKPKVQMDIQPKPVRKEIKVEEPKQELFTSKRTVGPVDELSQIDLNEFRTYGTDAKQIVSKVFEKISLLEKDSFSKMNEGIRGWKKSPVYKEYVSVGNMSLEQGVTIDEVLQKRGQLTKDEFEAIADLNEQLNY